MAKISDKERRTLLRFPGQDLPPEFTGEYDIVPNGINEYVSQFRDVNPGDFLKSILPDPDDEFDELEEVLLDDDNVYRTYNVVKNNRTGNIIRKTLRDAIEGVTLDAMVEGKAENPNLRHYKRMQLFEKLRDAVDPETGEFKTNIGKSFWDNSFENSPALYPLMTLVGKIASWDKTFGRYGTGFFAGKTDDFAFLNKLDIQPSGIYYDGMKLNADPGELSFVYDFLAKRTTYQPDSFADIFATTAMSFAFDLPLFFGAGAVGGKVVSRVLPSLSNATSLPGTFLKGFAHAQATLGLLETPRMIQHTFDGGVDAFVDDLYHLSSFSLMASTFGTVGRYVGLGVSKLLQRGSPLQLNEAANFLRRNPQITTTLSTGITSGMLGYTVGGEDYEERLATGLTFMALHFTHPSAWKSFLSKKGKAVMVENDLQREILREMNAGKTYKEAIKSTGANTPRYYLREGNNLYEIHSGKFTNYGEIEYTRDKPIELTPESAKNYKYISETLPFAKKSMRQAWNDQELNEIRERVRKDYFKDIKNPHEPGTDAYKSWELNKDLTAHQIGTLIFANNLKTELRRNQLPKDMKLEESIRKTAEYFNLDHTVYERHIANKIVDHMKDPKSLEAELRFFPEEYSKQFRQDLNDAQRNIIANTHALEIERALDRVFLGLRAGRGKGLQDLARVVEESLPKAPEIPTPEKRPFQPKEDIKLSEPLKPEKGELVTEKGFPLIGTKGAGLTEAERKAYGREQEPVKVSPKTIEGIKTLNDLNKAIETAESPTQLVKGVTEYSKREVIRVEDTTKEQVEKQREKQLTRNQKVRERREQKKRQMLLEKIQPEVESAGLVIDGNKVVRNKRGYFVSLSTPDRKVTKMVNVDKIKEGIEAVLKDKIAFDKKSPEEVRKLEKSSAEEIRRAFEEAKKQREAELTTEPPKETTKERLDRLNKEFNAELENLRKQGLSEEKIKTEAFENPESKANQVLQEIIKADIQKHRELLGTKEIKAVKLADGNVVTLEQAKSHLDFKILPKDIRSQIVDIGIMKEGKFESTATVPIEAYRKALDAIVSNEAIHKDNLNKLGTGIPLDPAVLTNYAKIGAYHFQRGFNTFASWGRKMMQILGEGVKNLLSRLWNITSQYMSGEKAILDPNTLAIGLGGKHFAGQRTEKPKIEKSKNNQKQPQMTDIEKMPEGISIIEARAERGKTVNPGFSERISEANKTEQAIMKKTEGLLARYKPRKVRGRWKGTTLTPDEYAQLQNIRTVTKLTPKEVETKLAKVGEAFMELENLRREGKDAVEIDRLEADLIDMAGNLTNFGALSFKRGEALKTAHNEVKHIVETGRSRHRAMEEARQERMKELRQMAKTSMGGFEALGTTEARLQGVDEPVRKAIHKIFESLENANLALKQIISKISPTDYKLGDYVMRRVKVAERNEALGQETYQTMLQTELERVFKKSGRELARTLQENSERQEKTGVFINEKELPLSQNEAYKKWMEWQNPRLRDTMERMGFNEKNIAQIEKFLTPEVRRWAEWQLYEFYPEYYHSINEVYRRMTFVDLPRQNNYSPIQRDVSKIRQDNELLQASSPFATVFNNSLKAVVDSKAELKYLDGNQVLTQHIAQMERFKAWTETIRELRSLFGNHEIKTIIGQRYGGEINGIINRYIDDLARGTILREKSFALIDKARGNFTRAVLGLNPTIFIKQLASMPAYMTKMPVNEWMKGFGEFLGNPKAAYELLMESPKMRARGKHGFERDIKELLAGKKTTQQLAGVKSVDDALMTLVKLGDRGAIIAGGYPYYKYHYNKQRAMGKTHAEAHKEALIKFEIVTEEQQQSPQVVDLSEWQRGGSWAKLFTMFVSQPNQYFRATTEATRDLLRKKGDPKQHWKTIAVTHFFLPMLFQFVSDGFAWNNSRQLRAAVLGSFNGILILGGWAESIVSAALGNWNFGITGTPVVDAPTQVYKGFEQLGKILDDGSIEMEEVLKVGDRFARGFSKFGGLPYEPVKRIAIGAMEAIEEGKPSLKLLGYGDVALRHTYDAMKEAKRSMNIYKKRWERNKKETDRTAYLEARREYERLVKELKEKRLRKETQQKERSSE